MNRNKKGEKKAKNETQMLLVRCDGNVKVEQVIGDGYSNDCVVFSPLSCLFVRKWSVNRTININMYEPYKSLIGQKPHE